MSTQFKFKKIYWAVVGLGVLASATATADEFWRLPGLDHLPALQVDHSDGGTSVSATAGVGVIKVPYTRDPNDREKEKASAIYGDGQGDLELGVAKHGDGSYGVVGGVKGHALVGVEAFDLDDSPLSFKVGGVKIAPHLGLEGHLHFSQMYDKDRPDYIDVESMGSVGLQASVGSYQILTAIAMGGGAGDLGDSGRHTSYRIGGELVGKGLKASGEWMHISSDRNPANIGSFDLKRVYPGPHGYNNEFFGIHVDTANTRGTVTPGFQGTSVMLTAGSANL